MIFRLAALTAVTALGLIFTADIVLGRNGICLWQMRKLTERELIVAGIKAGLDYPLTYEEVELSEAERAFAQNPECCTLTAPVSGDRSVQMERAIRPAFRVIANQIPYKDGKSNFSVEIDICGTPKQTTRFDRLLRE